MQIFHDMGAWRSFRKALSSNIRLGFVPTMGNLHQGHASLVQKSLSENDATVVSLFINPTQFNQREDFDTYPRTLDADFSLLEALGADYCLLPREEDIYLDQYRYKVVESERSLLMEGKQRPGHFDGVLTVVLKLLNLVQAEKAYFGEKDYQQYTLIQGMAEAFFIDTIIEACPTVRAPSSLALSSRNNRLKPEDLQRAHHFAGLVHQEGSIASIQAALTEAGIAVEYLYDYEGRRYVAVLIGGTRLIDNWAVETQADQDIATA